MNPALRVLKSVLLTTGAGLCVLFLGISNASALGLLDYGDAPEPFPTAHPMISPVPPAEHDITNATIFMGLTPTDDEGDGNPTPDAMGDDLSGVDDEDGVTFHDLEIPSASPALASLETQTVTTPTMNITISGAPDAMCHINAWIDFNQNGSWEDPGERIVENAEVNVPPPPAPPPLIQFAVSIPAEAIPGMTFARVRCSSGPLDSSGGLALDGEVEDHMIELTLPPADYGDALSPPYPGDGVSDSAAHIIVAGSPYLGTVPPDAEPGPSPTPYALGDDQLGVDDEDGMSFVGMGNVVVPDGAVNPAVQIPILPGEGILEILVSMPNDPEGGCYLSAWIDFDGNGSWFDPDDRIFGDNYFDVAPPLQNLIQIPGTAVIGDTYARVRCTSVPGVANQLIGVAPDGEVEDFLVTINDNLPPNATLNVTPDTDWVYAPYGEVTYQVVVSNTPPQPLQAEGNPEAFTLTALAVSILGDLTQLSGDCTVPQFIPGNETYTCSFTANVSSGPSDVISQTFSATAVDALGLQSQPQQILGLDLVDPGVAITLTYAQSALAVASIPTETQEPMGEIVIQEPVGDVAWTLTLTNTGTQDWEVIGLTDTLLGDLNGQGSCATGAILLPPPEPAPTPAPPPASNIYTCTFTSNHDANAGDVISNVVYATLRDPENELANLGHENAFEVAGRLPAITVSKTADPTSVPFGGGNVTYTLNVTNNNADLENVTLVAIGDDIFGPVAGGLGNCSSVPYTIGNRDGANTLEYVCSFEKFIDGPANSEHINVISVDFEDDDSNSSSEANDASVEIGPAPDDIFEDGFEALPKVVFATSTLFDGDLKTASDGASGLESADKLCNDHAQDAGLPGTYTAWLSDSTTDVLDRVTQADVPYVLPDGTTVVADNFTDLLDCTNPECLDNPIDQDQNGSVVGGNAWTGSSADGLKSSIHCEDWTSGVDTDHGLYGQISIHFKHAGWTARGCGGCECNVPSRLYCFQD